MGAAASTRDLPGRLMKACRDGDLPIAKALVTAGVSVNREGDGWLPLVPAVAYRSDAVVAWLLALGADPNGDKVMWAGAVHGAPDALQLLIDAGGDVNREYHGMVPLFWAIEAERHENVIVFLGQPSLDLTVTYYGSTALDYARNQGIPDIADTIAQEVSRSVSVRMSRGSRANTSPARPCCVVVVDRWKLVRSRYERYLCLCISSFSRLIPPRRCRHFICRGRWRCYQSASQREQVALAADYASVMRLVRSRR